MYKKYRYVNLKKLLNGEKKKDIKTSLILDDYSLYNKIHRIVRFWGKFTNYACPIFQVQKANLNLEKPKKDKKKYLFQNDFIKKNCSAKHFKLPVLAWHQPTVPMIHESAMYHHAVRRSR